MTDKEIKWLVHLGILKQSMSPYSSPIMLIARKIQVWKVSVLFFFIFKE